MVDNPDLFDIIAEMDKADAIVFGSPTCFGNMGAPMKKMWDLSTDLWFKGKLIGKPGGVFTGTSRSCIIGSGKLL